MSVRCVFSKVLKIFSRAYHSLNWCDATSLSGRLNFWSAMQCSCQANAQISEYVSHFMQRLPS
jgi:hypothetical protein